MKFKYKARDKNGKTVSGTIDALNRDVAISSLQQKGFFITFLEKEGEGWISLPQIMFNKISGEDIMVFFRQLSIMVNAGIPIVQSLESIVEQSNKKPLKELVKTISKDVASGIPLSDSLSKHPDYFSNLTIGLLKAGEASGTLPKSLNYLADFLESEHYLYGKIKGAMIYPVVIVVVMVVIMFIMAYFVLPNLLTIFENAENLPWNTKLIIWGTDIIRNYGIFLLLLSGVALFMAYKYFFHTLEGRKFISKALFHLPIIKKIFKKIYILRFAETFSTLLLSGISITAALDISSSVIGNDIYKKIIVSAKDGVKQGEKLSAVLSQFSPMYIDPIFIRMVYVGENTGDLGSALKNIVNVYKKDVEAGVETLLTMMEPALILILGLTVGFVVASIILPMYQNLLNFT